MSKRDNLRPLALSCGLNIINVTEGKDGKPENIYTALAGFTDFQSAQKFAEAHKLSLCVFHKREGNQLWERECDADEPLSQREAYCCAELAECTYDRNEVLDFWRMEIECLGMMMEQTTDSNILGFINAEYQKAEIIRTLGDNEFLIDRGIDGHEIQTDLVMEYTRGVHSFIIAASDEIKSA